MEEHLLKLERCLENQLCKPEHLIQKCPIVVEIIADAFFICLNNLRIDVIRSELVRSDMI